MLPSQLINAILWWEGLSWLHTSPSLWSISTTQLSTDVPEAHIQSFTMIDNEESIDITSRYSSLTKLKRVIAACMRFKVNCILSKLRSPRIHGSFRSEELQRAIITIISMIISMITIIKLHQQRMFSDELCNLQRSQPLDSHSKILSLNPIVDHDGLLRVG